MWKPIRRRTILKNSLGGLLGLHCAPLLLAADNGTPSPDISAIGNDISLLSGLGGNILVHNTPEGQILVDSGAAAHSDTLMAVLREMAPGEPTIHSLFNTHWHLDQVGGNEAIARAGANIIAHEKTWLRLRTDYYLPEEDRYQSAHPSAAHPTRTFLHNDALSTGTGTIEYGYLRQGHTDGDIYVLFREANVMAVGDIVSPERDPAFDWFGGGWIGGRLDSLDVVLAASNENTRFVPAYGPVVSRAQVQEERDMMQFLYDTLVDQIRMGYSARDSLETGLMDELSREFHEPYQFLYDAHKGLWAHHNKLEPNIV